jgi:hypothetical protein
MKDLIGVLHRLLCPIPTRAAAEPSNVPGSAGTTPVETGCMRNSIPDKSAQQHNSACRPIERPTVDQRLRMGQEK